MTPRFTSGWPNTAVSLATIMSHIIASSQPPPSAYPETAAITGFFVSAMCAHWPTISARSMSTADASAISAMSAPAANARSLPVITIAPMPSSRSNAASASTTSAISALLSAFRARGRFRRISPTRSRVSVRMCSYGIVCASVDRPLVPGVSCPS